MHIRSMYKALDVQGVYQYPVTGATGSCVLSRACLELNLCPLQNALLNNEGSAQLQGRLVLKWGGLHSSPSRLRRDLRRREL